MDNVNDQSIESGGGIVEMINSEGLIYSTHLLNSTHTLQELVNTDINGIIKSSY